MEESQFIIPVKCFQLVGFSSGAELRYPKLFHLFQAINIIVVMTCGISQIYFIQQNLKDVLASAESFTPLSIQVITLSKILTFYTQREKFYKLMDDIKSLSGKLSVSELLMLKQVNVFDRRVGLVYFTSGAIAGFGYCVKPIILNLVNVLIFETEFNHEMPFKSLFPYDTTKFPAYILTYGMFCLATYTVLFINVSLSP